jgi:hypothetical protein
MELQDAIDAYRERITYVLSQDPTATDEWIGETTDRLMEPFEKRRNGAGFESSESLLREERSV